MIDNMQRTLLYFLGIVVILVIGSLTGHGISIFLNQSVGLDSTVAYGASIAASFCIGYFGFGLLSKRLK